ncbi:MAG: nitrate/nitrite transporter NrtS [Actinobacteria bacterium]|nr:nitrate/nitrite transporter NrtS [Actinomycetota bacterium]
MISADHPGEGRPRRRIIEGIALCLERPNLQRTCTIALIVGCVLTLINQGDVLIAGHATARTAVKIVLNFCVPFVVSNLGVITGSRTVSGARHHQ